MVTENDLRQAEIMKLELEIGILNGHYATHQPVVSFLSENGDCIINVAADSYTDMIEREDDKCQK